MLTGAVLLATAQLAVAHFGVEYPTWRAATLGRQTNFSQWVYPCAGVPGNFTSLTEGGNRTDWPLTGGSIKLDLHHDWTYIFISLGIGSDVSNFNYTLTQPFLNSTGNGTLCIPRLTLPAGLTVSDGTEASIQVVTTGHNGNALYNCADITFRSSAAVLSGDDCKTDPGVTAIQIAAGPGAPRPSVSMLCTAAAVSLVFLFGGAV